MGEPACTGPVASIAIGVRICDAPIRRERILAAVAQMKRC